MSCTVSELQELKTQLQDILSGRGVKRVDHGENFTEYFESDIQELKERIFKCEQEIQAALDPNASTVGRAYVSSTKKGL